MRARPANPDNYAALLLRSARARAGLTQREVAALAEVTQPVVAAYESGRRQPTVPTLRRLLAATGHDLFLEAVPTLVPVPDKAVMASRQREMAAERRLYEHSPDDYLSLLRGLHDLDRLRQGRGLPPLPRDDDPRALRTRARLLGLLDG